MKIVEMLRMVLASIFLCLFVIGVSPALTEARVVQENYSLADIHRVSISDLQDLFYRVEIQKEIDIDFQNHLLEEALRYIAGEANLRLTYRGDIIKDWSVTIDREQISVSDALDQILAGTGLEYMVSQDGYLLISQIPVDTEQPVIQETVQGEVIDSETGELLPGVSIQIQGTAIGTPTNADGTYSLLVSSLNDTLIFSYLGYERTVVPIAGRTVIDVALNPVSIEGDEVVVVGYGTASQRNITGSVSSVRSDQLSTIARSSINQMLQGRVPGLNMATRGAQPGSGVTVNIRGAISSGNNTPLYVIDGVPMTSFNSTVPGLETGDLGFYGGIDRDPLSHLNPSDIESITVLKDASAAAIYGSAAANGVILVTTRGGQAGDLQVEYRGSYSVQTPKDYFPLLNERQFMEEQTRLSYDWYLYEHGLAPYGNNPTAAVPFSPFFSQQQIQGAGQGTDWMDEVSRTGGIQEHNIVLSGGNEQTRLYTSFSVHDNKAVLQNSQYTRYTGRINLDQTISNAVELSARLNIGQQNGQNATSGSNSGGAEKFNMIQAATSFAPTIPVYNEDGTYALNYNPLIMNPVSFLDIKDESTTNNLFFAPTLEITLSDNFEANFIGQVDRESSTRGFYLPRSSNHALLPEGVAQKREASRTNYTAEGFVTYVNSFANSELSVMAGAGMYYAENEGFNVEAIGFFTDAFEDNNIGVAHDLQRTRLGSFRSDQTKISQFMRVNYTLNDRYIIELVGRRDGSSRFAENHQYGFFPGISAAWILSEENFLMNSDVISELKLRVGYGQSGNESILDGNTLQLYTPGNEYVIGNTLYSGVSLNQIANPDLSWETITTFNAGLDFGLIRNRIRGSLDVYQRTATDRLANNPLPFNSPVPDVSDNVGSTQAYGVELSLNTTNISTTTLNWSTDFNISWQEARWVERNPRVPLDPWVGEKDLLGTNYGVRTAGIIRSEADIPVHQPNANLGNLIYVDTNGDGVLNDDDVTVIGNSIPKWRLGMRNEISYRNVSLSVYLYGNLDYDRGNSYSPNAGQLRFHGVPTNTTRFVSEVWTVDNPDGWRPGLAPNPHSGDVSEGTDFNQYDASFIRIQDITLGYNVPAGFLAGLAGIQDLRLFLTVQNLGVFTSYPGYDPEYTEPNPYPHSYSTTLGVDIRF